MRIIVPIGTLVLTALAALPVSAQMDLDSLLGELTYGEQQLVSENTDDADTELLPSPAAQADVASESLLDAAEAEESSPLPVNPGPPLPAEMLGERLKSRPKPAAPVPPSQSSVQMPIQDSTAMSSPIQHQGTPSPRYAANSYASQHSFTSAQAIASSGQCGCSAGKPCAGCSAKAHSHRGLLSHHGEKACDSPYECRPHHRPNLPPPSTSLEVFYARNGSSNLWAGYAKEAQQRDDRYMKHVHGTCDCLNKKHKKSCLSYRPPLYRAAAKPAPCPSCESGACDAHHRH